MLKSVINNVFGHKQLVIAVIAITALGFYASVDTMSAFAQRVINIPVPCLPYCNIEARTINVPGITINIFPTFRTGFIN
jgi:hypothetical protein